jgi:hypothetical protein
MDTSERPEMLEGNIWEKRWRVNAFRFLASPGPRPNNPRRESSSQEENRLIFD